MWTNKAIFLIGVANALNIREHPCLHPELYGATNDGGDNLTEEHWAMWNLHVVSKLEQAGEHNRLIYGIITPGLEQHHRNQAARKGVSDDQLSDDVPCNCLARSGPDHTQRERIHEC